MPRFPHIPRRSALTLLTAMFFTASMDVDAQPHSTYKPVYLSAEARFARVKKGLNAPSAVAVQHSFIGTG